MDCWGDIPEYNFEDTCYTRQEFTMAINKGDEQDSELRLWSEHQRLAGDGAHCLRTSFLKVSSKILDAVTTTDELIPSGETSSFRSNPLGLAEFTLSRRDPEYVGRSKEVDKLEKARVAGERSVCSRTGTERSIRQDPYP